MYKDVRDDSATHIMRFYSVILDELWDGLLNGVTSTSFQIVTFSFFTIPNSPSTPTKRLNKQNMAHGSRS